MLRDLKAFHWITGAALGLVAQVSCAAIITYTASLDGPSESPPNASPATGLAAVTVDTLAHTMRIEASFSGLLGTVTTAHIHCCTALAGVGTAGVATMTPSFAGFPTGVTSGSYDFLFDLEDASSWNAAFITSNGGTVASAEATLLAGLDAGEAYFNIHTSDFGGGEIRGFLAVQVPEPMSGSLAVLGLAALGLARRRSRGYARIQ